MIRFTLALTITASLMLCVVTGCSGPNGAAVEYESSSDSNAVRHTSFMAAPESAGPVDSTPPPAYSSSATSKSFADEGSTRHDAAFAATEEAGRPSADRPATTEGRRERERFTPQSGRQSGVLTAGSFDDVAHYDQYLSFLNRNRHQASSCQLPINARTHQTVITVTDSQGRPMNDVRCVVKCPQDGQQQQETTLLDMRTGTDGRIMLLSQLPQDAAWQQGQPLHLQVWSQQHQAPVIDEYRELQSAWNVTMQDVEGDLPTQLDLALVIDTTGSMGDELEYLKTEIDSIVASVNRMFPDVDQRYSLITYRDNGDEYVCRTYDFTTSLDSFRRHLDQQSANGGGDFPEAMDVALTTAQDLSWRTRNTARVLFLVGDAPPHQQNIGPTMRAIEGLRQRGVRLFPVGASGVETTAQIVMRTASLLTMGQYLFLTDHSGVGNPHATPDVSHFAVERLDRLMIRMIASELSGKRLAPQEVIAIENGERYTTIVPIPRRQPPRYTPPHHHAPATVYVVESDSVLSAVLQWIGRHSLSTLVAMITCVIVFERLTTLRHRYHTRCGA